MAKATRTVFRTPTQQEVEDFMNQAKPDWPVPFVQYYAQRFHAYYMSVGWVIGRKMMKDFKAAFWSQWQHVKFKEDKEMLEKCLNALTHRALMQHRAAERDGMFADQYGTATVGGEKPAFYYLEYYQKLMESYFQGQVPEKDLGKHYDRLKALGVMRIPREQINLIFELMGNDRDYGKTLSVVRLFKNLSEQKITLKNWYDKIHQQPAERQ